MQTTETNISEPLLTCIIFTYNHGNTIEHCIKSILEQKTEYSYEIQIWDDCSTDRTSDICRDYAQKYPDKIKYYRQPKNTFCGPYKEMQSQKAIRNFHSKYFCVIDGDDWWCNENKIQTALDFLETHPEYTGWAHDTGISKSYSDKPDSYVHDRLKLNLPEKIEMKDGYHTPLLYVSSRILRTLDWTDKHDLAIDYQMYWYHLSKGPFHYHDEIMAQYNVSPVSTFANTTDSDLFLQYPFKIMKVIDFSRDDFCTEMLKKYVDKFHRSNWYCSSLNVIKKIFGVKIGWYVWFIINFVPKFGFECINTCYIYRSRKDTKKNSDEITENFADIDIKFYKQAEKLFSLLNYYKTKMKRYKKLYAILALVTAASLLINIILLVKLFVF